MMRYQLGCQQDVGQRAAQQDDYYVSDLEDAALIERIGLLALLADGMGGLAFGREASRLAVRTLQAVYQERTLGGAAPAAALDAALRAADDAVSGFAVAQGQPGNVGTTVVAMVLHQGRLHWRSVGDSRLYLWRKPYLIALTEDHDYALQLNREVRAGRISQDQADRDPERGALISFVGQGPMALVDGSRRPLRLRSGDRLLACSDGLYKGLELTAIGQILDQSLSAQEAADNAVQRVLERRLTGQDNVTVLVIECDAERPTLRRPGLADDPAPPTRPGRRRMFPRKPKPQAPAPC